MSFLKTVRAAAASLPLLAPAPAAADVTLINVLEVPEGRIDTVIAAWEAARDFLSGQPGYVHTALHRAIAPDARFQLINVAIWETSEAFTQAARRMREAAVFPAIEGLTINPALYRVIRSDRPTRGDGQ